MGDFADAWVPAGLGVGAVPRRSAVAPSVLGCLDQEPARVHGAGPGDGALAAFSIEVRSEGTSPEVDAQLARVGEALEVTHLGARPDRS
jgi:hypothetical protein